MKKIEAISIYNLLKDAKINKVESNENKFAVIGIMKDLRPVVTDYEAFAKDAQEKLQGDNHEDMVGKAQKWQGKTATTDEEKEEVRAINTYFAEYQQKVEDCLRKEADSEVEVKTISEECYKGLVASNDGWTLGQIEMLGGIVK